MKKMQHVRLSNYFRGLNEFAVNATIGFHSVPLGGSEFHGSKLKKKAKMYYMKKVSLKFDHLQNNFYVKYLIINDFINELIN